VGSPWRKCRKFLPELAAEVDRVGRLCQDVALTCGG
jgi:hypothetical protein